MTQQITAIVRGWIGTDHQGTDDQCPAVPPPVPSSDTHLFPSDTHLFPSVPPTCAHQCHSPVP
ncbi:unnamed protein product, partial [Staurois parvus]